MRYVSPQYPPYINSRSNRYSSNEVRAPSNGGIHANRNANWYKRSLPVHGDHLGCPCHPLMSSLRFSHVIPSLLSCHPFTSLMSSLHFSHVILSVAKDLCVRQVRPLTARRHDQRFLPLGDPRARP